jgi:hypothetical protein
MHFLSDSALIHSLCPIITGPSKILSLLLPTISKFCRGGSGKNYRVAQENAVCRILRGVILKSISARAVPPAPPQVPEGGKT